MTECCFKKFLIIEPFYGGSHKKMIDIICSNFPESLYTLVTMKAKKWHWRARTSALYVSTQIPQNHKFEVIFCTSVLPLAELLGLRADLVPLQKIVFFHENQLEFPVQITKERDFQYGFNEILTSIVADKVLFNSCYNRDSFLSHINNHLRLQPDYKIKDLNYIIQEKCCVIHYPLDLDEIDVHVSSVCEEDADKSYMLHIVWPHRWEFDKDPETFYRVLCKLDQNGYMFKLSILGETFNEKPEVFEDLSNKFKSKIVHCGYIDSLAEYYKILKSADVVVSTAIHEFFGVSILEAVYCGCIPVVPNRLVYKELYAGKVEEMYDTEDDLYTVLAHLCNVKNHGNLKKNYRHLALPYDSKIWLSKLKEILNLT